MKMKRLDDRILPQNPTKEEGVIMSYNHLTEIERYHIHAYFTAGYKKKEIAKVVNKHPSTITREIQRNFSFNYNLYFPGTAQRNTQKRKNISALNSTKVFSLSLKELIIKYLNKYFSPEQISAKLRNVHKIIYSYVSIYKFIHLNRMNGGKLYLCLRQSGKRRVKYGHRYKGGIQNRVSISKRDEVVLEKSRLGDFEADTIIGGGQKGAIVTIVDRKSMYLKMSVPTTKHSDSTAKIMIKLLKGLKTKIHTITTDNGFEFSAHQKVSKALNCHYYFCHPYSSWERGLNENINGLIRQYIPKGSSFSKLTQRKIKFIEDSINHRPRKSLDWKTPYEVFHGLQRDFKLN